ncbi:MAG: branched-chain amino acid ABC transporter permease, partial [Jiangellaceae bacterium]
FAHGAFYMLGAVGAFVALDSFGVGWWAALLIVPIILAVFGMLLERTLVRRLIALDPLYNFLLTFGIALILQDLVRLRYGVASQPYTAPALLEGSIDLGPFNYPKYQVFVFVFSIVVSVAVWLVLSRTRIGMIVRASTERPDLTGALGINVGRWVTPVFGFGIGLAGLAGVLAAPMRAINATMGSDLIIVIFAVVVIGGLGSIFGSVAAGYIIGMLTAVGNFYVPALSQSLVFILMALVLLLRPAGLFGREEGAAA